MKVLSNIIDSLSNNSTLKILDLTGIFIYLKKDNRINNELAIELGIILNKNKSIQYLYLSTNKIGKTGISKISSSLKENNSLIHLDLSCFF
jgi:Ran GTPase-activating protein (RanGAP) involved in mRNA processing and transport